MNCREFLDRHSDYLDDRLAPDEGARWEEHVCVCTSCARYDKVVRRGTELLRNEPDLEAQGDIAVRVHRQARYDGDPAARDRWTGGAFALAIAALLALIAWSPVLRSALSSAFEEDALAQPVPDRPLAEDFAGDQSAAMALETSSWTPGYAAPSLAAATFPMHIRTAQIIAPGPYSPLIVEPPRYEPYPPPRRVVWGVPTRPQQ